MQKDMVKKHIKELYPWTKTPYTTCGIFLCHHIRIKYIMHSVQDESPFI